MADDGSGPATADVVREAAGNHPHAMRHVWQEDRGFRFRLRLAGLEPKLVIVKAYTFHLFHPKIDRTGSRSARRAWDASKSWCPNGLSKADAPPASA